MTQGFWALMILCVYARTGWIWLFSSGRRGVFPDPTAIARSHGKGSGVSKVGACLREWLTRGACGALWVGFPLLRMVSPAVRRQSCLWRSRLLRGMLPCRLREQSRVNCALRFGRGGRAHGHCWVTVAGREYSSKSRRPRGLLVHMGRYGEVDYWTVSGAAKARPQSVSGGL